MGFLCKPLKTCYKAAGKISRVDEVMLRHDKVLRENLESSKRN